MADEIIIDDTGAATKPALSVRDPTEKDKRLYGLAESRNPSATVDCSKTLALHVYRKGSKVPVLIVPGDLLIQFKVQAATDSYITGTWDRTNFKMTLIPNKKMTYQNELYFLEPKSYITAVFVESDGLKVDLTGWVEVKFTWDN